MNPPCALVLNAAFRSSQASGWIAATPRVMPWNAVAPAAAVPASRPGTGVQFQVPVTGCPANIGPGVVVKSSLLTVVACGASTFTTTLSNEPWELSEPTPTRPQ